MIIQAIAADRRRRTEIVPAGEVGEMGAAVPRDSRVSRPGPQEILRAKGASVLDSRDSHPWQRDFHNRRSVWPSDLPDGEVIRHTQLCPLPGGESKALPGASPGR